MKKWILLNRKGDTQAIRQKYKISEPMSTILINRQIIDLDNFLSDNGSLHDGRLLKDAEKTVAILREKIADGKRIRIFGDMDVDGVTATTILMRTITSLGGDVDYDIPHRVKDGYGANVRMVEQAHTDGVDTIITVDNGIAAFEAVNRAKALGMTVLVTDHHEVPFEEVNGEVIYQIPKADAVVDPQQMDCSYPFPGICGAMVAYKIAELLLESSFVNTNMNTLIELAALGTVCDVMELVDENRVLVKTGISLMKDSSILGIRKLVEVNNIALDKLSTYHMGFVIGPSVNSSGRLDTAKKSVELLLTEDIDTAEALAMELKALNDKRKQMTAQAQEAAEILVQQCITDKVYILYLPDCHESIAGIVAGRIKELYHHPTIVLTDADDGGLKGSARSIENYHIFDALTRQKHLLGKFGGHAMAAGLSLSTENLGPLRDALNASCALSEDDFQPKVYIDVYLPIHGITEAFIQDLTLLEPYGTGNPHPVIADKGLSILSMTPIGQSQNMLKLNLRSTRGTQMKAVFFGDRSEFEQGIVSQYGAECLEEIMKGRPNPARLLCSYTPTINDWNGYRNIEITIKDYEFI